MNILNIFSLIFEIVVAFLGVWIGVFKKKLYGWLISLTFIIYVGYDLSRFMGINAPAHDILFFIASASITFAVVWLVVKENKGR